jgi:hypothetical protein
MRRDFLLAMFVGIALITAGCTGGREFTRPPSDALTLGTTTETEVRQRLGEPRRKGTSMRNGVTITTLAYGYSLAMPYVDDVKTRGMGFYFLNGVLVGYDFTSSFPEDKTRFDDGKVPQIERGRSTRQDVVALLGQPSGMYAHPLIKDKESTGLVYLFVDTDRHPFVVGVKQRRKLLIVTCDGQGVVTDVAYSTSEPN